MRAPSLFWSFQMLLPEHIRRVENKLFKEQILSDKAVQGIVRRAINANKTTDNAWIENIVRAECKVTLKNRQDAPKLKAINSQRPPDKQLSGISQYNDEPKPLAAMESTGYLTLIIPGVPEYQRCTKYVRFIIRYLGYDCEVRVKPQNFETFLAAIVKPKSSATVSGNIEETPHGFLMQEGHIRFTKAKLLKKIHQIQPQATPI